MARGGVLRWLSGVVLACTLAACARESPAVRSPQYPSPGAPSGPSAPGPHAPSGRPYEVGIASYYHDGLAGRKTANGEIYDPRKLTAAHKTLPFGTVVEVRAKKSGRRVVVRINDRGPFSKKRVIDLSRAAAEELKMIRAGIIEVELHVLSWPPEKPKKKRKR